MARKANGQGHTYKVGNSYRTVIRCGDHLITAMAATAQDSRKKAKLKLESMPNILAKRSALPSARLTIGAFLLSWLEGEHKHNIAHSTFKRYRALLVHHIEPVIGDLELQKTTPADISKVISRMREAGQSPRSQQQARALLSVGLAEAENKGYIALNPDSMNRKAREKSVRSLGELTNWTNLSGFFISSPYSQTDTLALALSPF